MALFESYDRRIDHINAVLNEYGINGIEDAKAISSKRAQQVYLKRIPKRPKLLLLI